MSSVLSIISLISTSFKFLSFARIIKINSIFVRFTEKYPFDSMLVKMLKACSKLEFDPLIPLKITSRARTFEYSRLPRSIMFCQRSLASAFLDKTLTLRTLVESYHGAANIVWNDWQTGYSVVSIVLLFFSTKKKSSSYYTLSSKPSIRWFERVDKLAFIRFFFGIACFPPVAVIQTTYLFKTDAY